MRLKSCYVGGLALLLLSAVGCGREALNYNNAMVKIDKDMENVLKNFVQNMQQNKGNIPKIRELHTKAVADLGKLVQEGKALKAPNVSQGPEMHQAFVEYVTTMEKIVRDDYAKLITLSAENKVQAADEIVRNIERVGNEQTQKLKAAQMAFAKANNFKLVNQ